MIKFKLVFFFWQIKASSETKPKDQCISKDFENVQQRMIQKLKYINKAYRKFSSLCFLNKTLFSTDLS